VTRKRFSVLRDPVHGDVYLTHEELRVLDTPEMQRLRGVKQLGTAFLAYPGALHTRFDHSIGVLHVTARMIEAINRNFDLDPRQCLAVGENEVRVVRMAALVHDVTHIPYGHNIEDQTGLFHRHDSAYRFERRLDPRTPLGGVLEELGLRRDVLATLLAESDASEGREAGAVPPYWSQIMSDTISSDILDYLARDAYFTGLRLGVDPRIANYFRIDRGSGNLFIDLAKRDLLREDILSEVVRMLEARYYFSERVYYHHAKVAAGALIARAVELAVVNDLVEEADFYDLTDASLVDLLRRRTERAAPETGRRIASLLDRFEGRRLLKRACVFPRYENQDVQAELVEHYFTPGRRDERAEVEERITSRVRAVTGADVEVVLYCPAARMQLKEAQTHVRWPGEAELRPLSDHAERVPRLSDLERSYRDLWKFYVLADTSDPGLLARVQGCALEELPTATNVYRIEHAN
jgi:HD superfamily phosphohydrolase